MFSKKITYKINHATSEDVMLHLKECGSSFVPPLEQRVDVNAYALKIADQADTLEAWVGNELIGLIAVYCNDQEKRKAFITNVSIKERFGGMGIASELLEMCIRHVKAVEFVEIQLEVDEWNDRGRFLYKKHGFKDAGTNGRIILMRRKIV